MRNVICCAGMIAVSMMPAPVFAAAAAVPTGGTVTVLSAATGAVAVTESRVQVVKRSKLNRFFLGTGGLLLLFVDPPGATYLSGTSVINYPNDRLQLYSGLGDPLTWFGAFSEDPNAVPPPVSPTGTFETDFSFDRLGPNPALDVSLSDSEGQLSVAFESQNGIEVDTADPINMFGVIFENVSGSDLVVTAMEVNSNGVIDPTVNFLQDPSMQSLVCIPPGEELAQACGEGPQFIGFSVQIPEPSGLVLLLLGGVGILGVVRRRRQLSG